MHHVLMTGLVGLLLATGGLAAADPKTPTVKTSRTCKYKSGIKAGETQYFGDIDPVPIGAPCEDGGGSSGVVVADLPRVAPKPVPTSRTCKFKDGAKAGQAQYFPDAQPIPIGSPCEDGGGSFGVAVADSKPRATPATGSAGAAAADPKQRATPAVKTSRTCKYARGSKAGHAQFFASATPIELGASCDDGVGSSGVAVADTVSERVTSRTCAFTTGPRKGKSQHFPEAQPIQRGNYCEDGAGSAGVAVADAPQAKKPTAQR